MNDSFRELTDDDLILMDQVCDEYEEALRENGMVAPSISGWLKKVPQRIHAPLTAELSRIREEFLKLDESHVNADAISGLWDPTDETSVKQQVRIRPNPGSHDRPLPSRFKRVSTFDIIECIGKGGMGVVYKAEDTQLKRHVAVKMLLAADHASQTDLNRFHLEAETVAKLQHENIVQVYEVGQHEQHPYIALEYIDGSDLGRLVAGQPQPQITAARVASVLARAMQHAHENGIVHRDLKPANILMKQASSSKAASSTSAMTISLSSGSLTSHDDTARERRLASAQTLNTAQAPDEGFAEAEIFPLDQSREFVPKITDFGLAKNLTAAAGLTASGLVMGTPQFMAPEQASEQHGQIGVETDIYGIGGILFYLLTGRPPFTGSTPVETILAVRNEQPVAPRTLVPGTSADLDTICLRCLEKDPGRRFSSASELADELDRFLSGEPILSRPVGHLERSWRWCRRNSVVAALLATCAFLTVAGFGAVTWKWREAKAHELEANVARGSAVRAQHSLQRQTSRLLFDRGLELCERGNINEGVHWFLASLKACPSMPDDARWESAIRTNLSGWLREVNLQRFRFELEERPMVLAVHPGGTQALAGCLGGRVYRLDLETGRILAPPIQLDITESGWSGVWALEYHPSGDWFFAGGGAQSTGTLRSEGLLQKFDSQTGAPIGDGVRLPYSVEGALVIDEGDTVVVGVGDHDRGEGFIQLLETQELRPVSPRLDAPGRNHAFQRTTNPRVLRISFQTTNQTQRSWLDLKRWKIIALTNSQTDPKETENSSSDPLATSDRESEPLNLEAKPDSPYFAFKDSSALKIPPAFMATNANQNKLAWLEGSAVVVADAARGHSSLDQDSPVSNWRSNLGMDAIAIDPMQRFVLGGTADGHAWLRKISNGEFATLPWQHGERVGAVAFNHDGSRFAIGSSRMRVFDTATTTPCTEWLSHTNTISALAFSPDGRILAAGDYAQNVILWDPQTGRQLGDPIPQNDIVISLAFSPDGRQLAVGTASDWNHDPQARLWDLETRKPVGPPMRHGHYVRDLAFTSDGEELLTISSDSTIRIWSSHDCRPVTEPIPYSHGWGRAVLSPDDQTILSGAQNGDLRLWLTQTGAPISGKAYRTGRPISALNFSQDGSLFAVGYRDGTTQLFDSREFVPLGPARAAGGSVRQVRFLGPDRWLSVAESGTLFLHDSTPPIHSSTSEIANQIELATNLTLDDNNLPSTLTTHERQVLVSSAAAYFPEDSNSGMQRQAWHERRVKLAESAHLAAGTRWHLNQISSSPSDQDHWHLAYAASFTSQGSFARATKAYDEARRNGVSNTRLLLWYSHRLQHCRDRGKWAAATWYVDRLLFEQGKLFDHTKGGELEREKELSQLQRLMELHVCRIEILKELESATPDNSRNSGNSSDSGNSSISKDFDALRLQDAEHVIATYDALAERSAWSQLLDAYLLGEQVDLATPLTRIQTCLLYVQHQEKEIARLSSQALARDDQWWEYVEQAMAGTDSNPDDKLEVAAALGVASLVVDVDPEFKDRAQACLGKLEHQDSFIDFLHNLRPSESPEVRSEQIWQHLERECELLAEPARSWRRLYLTLVRDALTLDQHDH